LVVWLDETSDRIAGAIGLGGAEPVAAAIIVVGLFVWVTYRKPRNG
jgi:hypothetical protein